MDVEIEEFISIEPRFWQDTSYELGLLLKLTNNVGIIYVAYMKFMNTIHFPKHIPIEELFYVSNVGNMLGSQDWDNIVESTSRADFII